MSWLITPRKCPRKSKRRHHQHYSRGGRSRIFVGKSIACSTIFLADFWRSPFGRSFFDIEPFQRAGAGFGVSVPAVDVTQTDKGYEITAELPGMEEKDVEVKLSNGILTIKGEKSL
jgi:HSP20 family molecular chaperone IbpA